ncbi:MAG: universal stress protein [Alphaproteobacteria bacterium]|nr:universal stress protein [Alphaproteobacteria bacterium]
MGFKTLMVHLELGRANDRLLAVAGDLAQRLKAHVIGIAACQPIQLMYNETYISGEIVEQDREQIEKQLGDAERQMRTALDALGVKSEWRSTITPGSLADFMAVQARAADLVLTGPSLRGSTFDHTRQVNVADLAMEAGRPVLIVPHGRDHLDLNRAMVAWKSTRESRRAVADALPLLKLAHEVSVVEVVGDEEIPGAKQDVTDVAAWLARHGVIAKPEAVPAIGPDAERLYDLARERQVDLIVAGAYGHRRVREWIFGGVTADFLMTPDRCVMLSH